MRKIGNGDGALSAACPATRRRPSGDPEDQLDDGAGLAVAALQNQHRGAQPGAVAPLGSLVASRMPQWQVYKDESPRVSPEFAHPPRRAHTHKKQRMTVIRAVDVNVRAADATSAAAATELSTTDASEPFIVVDGVPPPEPSSGQPVATMERPFIVVGATPVPDHCEQRN